MIVDRETVSPSEARRKCLTLSEIPVKDLQLVVEELREDWEVSARFARNCESEFVLQRQLVSQLEAQQQELAGQDTRSLQVEIAHERERMARLESRVFRQRQSVLMRGAEYRKYWQALQEALQKQAQESEAAASLEMKASGRDWDTDRPDTERDSHLVTTQVRDRLASFEADDELDLESDPWEIPPDSEKAPCRKKNWLRWTVLSLSAAGLLCTGLSFLLLSRPDPTYSTVTPEALAVPDSVAALGYLEPQGEAISVSAPVFTDGVPRVEQLLVQQGDRVKAGQVIAILDSRDRLQTALAQAEQQVSIARAKLAQVRAGTKSGTINAQTARYQRTQAELNGQVNAQKATIADLEAQLNGERKTQQATVDRINAELQVARSECTRYQLLFQEGVISLQERDRSCLQQKTTQQRLKEAQANLTQTVSTLQNRVKEANANLNRTVRTLVEQIGEDRAMLEAAEEVRPVDVQVAKAELDAAQVAVKKARADLAQAYVRAPRAGQILKILTWPGEMADKSGIVQLGQTDRMYVTAEIDETDIQRVRVGQSVRISSEGVVRDIQGVVDKIGLQVDKQKIRGLDPTADTDARVVEVKIRLSPEDSRRVASLTNLQVNVVIDTEAARLPSQLPGQKPERG